MTEITWAGQTADDLVMKSSTCSIGKHYKCPFEFRVDGEVWRCGCKCHATTRETKGDNGMSYSMTDRAGDEQDGIERAEVRAEESLREQRWMHFSDVLADYTTKGWLTEVATAYIERNNPDCFGHGRLAWHMQQFALTEGWHGVLNAIARAMLDEANARAKAEVAAGHRDAPGRPSPLSEIME